MLPQGGDADVFAGVEPGGGDVHVLPACDVLQLRSDGHRGLRVGDAVGRGERAVQGVGHLHGDIGQEQPADPGRGRGADPGSERVGYDGGPDAYNGRIGGGVL